MQTIPTMQKPAQPSTNLPPTYQPPQIPAYRHKPIKRRINGLLRGFRLWLDKKSMPSDPLVHSYLFLRRGIGIIGVALPIVLVIGAMIVYWRFEIMDSISDYYYTLMRDVLIGSLCAMGIFLICYRYALLDDIVSTLAGLCAIGVALFPTTPSQATGQQVIIGCLHEVFAASLFVILAVMAIFLFRKTNMVKRARRKQQRDMVYLVCGIVILSCVVLSALVLYVPLLSTWLQPIHPILVLEGLAIWAFGLAWFVKGGTLGLLKDA